MKITIFTNNQPRHLSLIKKISAIAEKIWVIEECNTVFPGKLEDFYSNTSIMQRYFAEVRASENRIFGNISFLPNNVQQLAIKDGDLYYLPFQILDEALHSDYYIVFGSSFIKGYLADFLISNNAINIHMGISPNYRGNSCNFWALYDQHPEYVGATIMRLSKKLDDGDILFHVFPKPNLATGFDLGMLAVSSAHKAIVKYLQFGNSIYTPCFFAGFDNTISRLTKRCDFTDAVVEEYLNSKMMPPEVIYSRCKDRNLSHFINPVIC